MSAHNNNSNNNNNDNDKQNDIKDYKRAEARNITSRKESLVKVEKATKAMYAEVRQTTTTTRKNR